ncbi:MAG TPA: hypothetical protein DF480_05900 [Clostridiales bacterium]|nr:hypothetical protein [Clostridiales bacterium]
MADSIRLIERELQFRRELLRQYEKYVESGPAGHVSIRKVRNGNLRKYYHCIDPSTGKINRRNLHDEDAELIRQLKLKAYVLACIPILKKSIRMIKQCMDGQEVFDPLQIERRLGKGYEGICLQFQKLAPQSEDAAWTAIPERQNTSFPERLIYQAAGGMYRSKSEMIIATQLARFEIPFKYEPAIEMGSFRFYPDFVARNPLDGELVYWEHLGLLSKEEYRRSTQRKLEMYHVNGIRPGDNLILTCDGDGAPLSALKIERVIWAHFL